jgi:oxygen-independent coproporphyrinogen-3 oxidase
MERVAAMADLAAGLRPDRVALFGYAHVPWMKSHQRLIDEASLPGAEQRWAQFETASERLLAAGYVAVGLDHFARPDDPLAVALADGRLRRNFQGYTTDDAAALLGFGGSAIGALPQGYVQNAAPLGIWAKAVRAGRPATSRGFALAPEDRLRAALIERLMCDMRIDLAALCARFGVPDDHFDRELAGLDRLVGDGIVDVSGRTVRVTEQGRPLIRVVASAFDSYLGTGERRHARAV